MAQAITIIGGGLSGCEAAWQAAEQGLPVDLYEMRPERMTEAHRGDRLAELVCSNSLGSALPDRPSGLLKEELRRLGSLLIRCADRAAVPAGGALAVDRDVFSGEVESRLDQHPLITLRRQEVERLPDGPCILASGPLTSPALTEHLRTWTGDDHLYFFDAIAPIVVHDSIDFSKAFRASRYGRGEEEGGDYINCPFDRRAYEAFIDALLAAERIPLHPFEQAIDQGVQAGHKQYFEGCLPIEVLAARGRDALAYGPLRPVGLRDPRTGHRPHAVLQLRQDDVAGTLYNLVGFQTNLKFPEQERVFRTIPGLEKAEFERLGQMHRNTFLAAPRLLQATLQSKARPDLFVAGQLTGVEGYAGNIATGWLAGMNAGRVLRGAPPLALPATTMLGALCDYITRTPLSSFQPMKANFGLLPATDDGVRRGKRDRARAKAETALAAMEEFMRTGQV